MAIGIHRIALAALIAVPLAGPVPAAGAEAKADKAKDTTSSKETETSMQPRVAIETSKGTIVVELAADKTPITVENFLQYVDDGFYDGTIFHRVIEGFMVQGGGFTADMERKETREPIKNEAKKGLKNKRGTIAMARTSIPDSATAQFFINHKDNPNLDFRNPSAQGAGYAAFGTVVEGMDVVDAIADMRTTSKQGMRDVPVETVTIETIRRVE